MIRHTASFAVVVFSVAACGPQGPTYQSNVQPLVAARCGNCHVQGGIAPFPLQTYAEVKAQGPAMVAAVKSGLMPPWRAAPADVSYLHDPQLSKEQQTMLETWVTDGMPEGDKSAKKIEVAPVGGGIERVDVTLQLPEPYTPGKTPDDYRCFPIRWPNTELTYVTGFNALPDQTAEVHHVALYVVPPNSADLPFQWD